MLYANRPVDDPHATILEDLQLLKENHYSMDEYRIWRS